MPSNARKSGSHAARWVAALLLIAPAYKLMQSTVFAPRAKAVSAEVAARGAVLFNHEFTTNDPLTGGDGLGPVYNARSCVDCHFQGGPGGGGSNEKNVTVYGIPNGVTNPGIAPVGVVHAHAVKPELQETLYHVNPGLPRKASLPLAEVIDPAARRGRPVVVTQRNTPALFGDGLIDAVSEDTLVRHMREHSTPARLVGLNGAVDGKIRGRVSRLADGRIGRFGWKGEFSTLNDFVKAACANELGLSNPERPQATSIAKVGYKTTGVDLSDAQCDLMTDYLTSLAPPVEVASADADQRAAAAHGKETFKAIGCADCHSPDLGPASAIYSDLLLHDMGIELESSTGYYGAIVPPPVLADTRFSVGQVPSAGDWRTAPLWGVADSAPYLHDGRAPTLDDAIALHGGEAVDVTGRYKGLSGPDRRALLTFLSTLRAPGATVPRPPEAAPSTTVAAR